MHSNGEIINTKTFDIINDNNLISIDKDLAKSISILNKKGYYTYLAYSDSLSRIFSINNLLYELIHNNLININNNKKVIKKVIEDNQHEAIAIIFKDNYNFLELPKNFISIDNSIFYFVKILKSTNNIEFKEAIELVREKEQGIKYLEEWANSLPDINGGKNV